MKKIIFALVVVIVMGIYFFNSSEKTEVQTVEAPTPKKVIQTEDQKVVEAQKAYDKVIEDTPAKKEQEELSWEEAEKVAFNLRASLNEQEKRFIDEDVTEDNPDHLVEVDEREEEMNRDEIIVADSEDRQEEIIEEFIEAKEYAQNMESQEEFSGDYFQY